MRQSGGSCTALAGADLQILTLPFKRSVAADVEVEIWGGVPNLVSVYSFTYKTGEADLVMRDVVPMFGVGAASRMAANPTRNTDFIVNIRRWQLCEREELS